MNFAWSSCLLPFTSYLLLHYSVPCTLLYLPSSSSSLVLHSRAMKAQTLHLAPLTCLLVLSVNFLCGDCWTATEEVQALHDIYVNSLGKYWTWKNDSIADWNFTISGEAVTDPCGSDGLPWEGLTCFPFGSECGSADEECHVTGIDLYNYNLVGSIPPSIGNFSYLEYLSFWTNRMTGSIPPEIGRLSGSLTFIDFDDNKYNGTIPEELFQLTKLTSLYLSRNLVSGSISESLSAVASLENLFMSNNDLTGTMPSLSAMSNLTYMSFQNNHLTGTLPTDVGSLTKLRLFNVPQNNLNGTIPVEFGEMTGLFYLGLGINDFTGTIPPALGKLENLIFLGMHFNSLTATIPSEMQSLKSMKNLWLHNNMLTGQVPRGGAMLESLESFFMYNNLLTGSLPSELGALPNVFVIRLYNNLLTGVIPSSIGRMSHVKTFDVSGNFLTGTLPVEVGQLISLEDLELHNNYLSGALPVDLGKLMNLLDLELSFNRFTTLPNELGNLTNLKKFFIQNNNLEGEITNLFWQPELMSLQHIDFSGNLLDGSIPSDLFSIPGIRSVALSINCFTGELPVSICNAKDVNVLSMDGVGAARNCPWRQGMFPIMRRFKALDGSVPRCVWSMDNLTVLHLSGNGLTGNIGAFTSASKMLNMSLAHNRFSGTIPRALQSRGSLLELDLSYNKITGQYTHGMPGNDEKVTLQVNRLSGRLIKSSLEKVSYLDILVDNRFDCRDIPSSDINAHDYSCESVDLDKSLYSMAGIVCFIVSIFVSVTLYRRSFMNQAESVSVGIETEPWVHQRYLSLLVNANLYFSCMDNLVTLTSGHVLLKISNFSEELFAIMKGCFVLLCVSIVMNVPLYSLKLLDDGVEDGKYSTYTHMYSWRFSAAYTSGEIPAVLLLITWCIFMTCFVFFIWKFSKKYGDLFFERFSSANTACQANEVLLMTGVILCNGTINACVNGVYIFSSTQNTSRGVTFLIQVTMAVWNIFASLVIVPTLSKPIVDFEKCIKTRLFMFISNSMIIPCLVAMRVSPSCFESIFRKPDEISSVYSYEDCLVGSLNLESGVYTCAEYAEFTVDVPPLTPPFSYNYDCSSVILTSYIPVYIYMYALLALAPLFVMLFGLVCHYEWFPDWVQARFPGILWPYQWAMRDSNRERIGSASETPKGSLRVRTMSDMSSESGDSDSESDAGILMQQPEPRLMINVVPIVTSLMHNLYILSTFGLCSPYLAIMIVICNSSHVTMWKVMLGRFVACRVIKGAEIESAHSNRRGRNRLISRTSFAELNIHELMEKKTSRYDVALLAMSEQLNDAKGIFAICIWPILLSSSFFFIFVSLDIAGDQVSWTGGLWIPGTLVVGPLVVMWLGMKMLMHKRALAASGSSNVRDTTINAVELNTVQNVLHSQA